MTRIMNSSTAHVVHVTTVLVALLSLILNVAVSVSATATPSTSQQPQPQPQRTSPEQQTSVLNRLLWRNLEEQDAFIHTLFRKPLATANIGVVTSSTASEGATTAAAAAASVNATDSTEARLVPQLLQQPQQRRGRQGSSRSRGGGSTAHHAPANTTGAEKRLFMPKLHLVYTITEERKRALEQAAAAAAAVAIDVVPSPATVFGASYTQMLRAVLPIGLGGPMEAEAAAAAAAQRPLTPLQAASLASPITPLRSYVIEASAEGGTPENMEASPKAELSSPRAAQSIVEAADGAAAVEAQGQTASSLSQAQSSAEETLVVVASATKAVVPLTIVGTSYTVVQFDATAGNTINAVVQLKDHRYDERVSTRNCFNMYLKVELRNHVKTGKDEAKEGSTHSSSDAAQGSTAPHAYIDKDQWSGGGGGSGTSSTNSAANDGEGEDISTAHRGSWTTFWDSFALMFDTSALCKVLPSVSMRVSRAPQTEPFYVVLRSTTGYAYETAYYYNTTSGAFYANTRDEDYVCDLDLFIEQWPAAEQERRQLIFSFIFPLLVLLLPLPFTMRRADLVQQYMMETDYAEWVWRPPYFLRNRMMDGLGMLVAWVQRLRCAYRQQSLRAQLLQRQEEDASTHLPAQSLLPPASMSAPSGRPVDVKREEKREETVREAAMPQHPPLPATTAANDIGSETREDAAEHRACTPRGQFKESPSAASSQASDTSHLEHSSTGSVSGSDADEPLDGRARHTRLQQQQQSLPPLRSRECSEHPGAVSPPHPVHSQHLSEGGAMFAQRGAAGSSAASSFLQIGEPLGSSSAGDVNNNRHTHRFNHHRHGASCQDGAAGAVSVHVPFTIDSPVLHWSHHPHHTRGSEAHDLLFTTAEEVTSSGEERRDGLHTRRSREEAEAQGLLRPQQPPPSPPPQQDQPPVPAASGDAAAATTSRTRKPEAEEEEEPFCRICREGSDIAPLITPCGCTGSVRFVHAACLDRWRLESAKRNLANVNNCEICKLPFTVTIQRSTLIWEGSQQFLRGFCLFFTCFCVVVLTTTLTHGILGELSCLASYHEVAYSTMFRFEGLSLSLFVYGLAVLLVLFANLIVYSWFRSRPEVEEYVAEVHAIPPFYTRYNVVLIVLVSLLLLAQVHAMGFLLKYFLYNTSHLVWSWETSPLVGGMLFALFTTCSITICSWGRQIYVVHVVNRGNGVNPAEDVVVEGAGGQTAAAPAPTAAPPSGGPINFPTSTTLNYVNTGVGASPAPPAAAQTTVPGSPSVPFQAGTLPSSVEPDVTYSQHFAVPPEQRVIRAYEYCPPRRKVPK